MWTPKDVVDHPLYVVTCVFNPVRFKSRYALYREFQKHIRESGAVLLTVEAAMGDREFALEEHAQPSSGVHDGHYKSFGPPNVPPSAAMPRERMKQDYIKVRVNDEQEIWLKENLLNIGVQHLPPDAKYVAFVDADVHFSRTDWVSETLHALQHYEVAQMFTTACDMSPTHDVVQTHQGFGFNWINGVDGVQIRSGGLATAEGYYQYGAPGGKFTSYFHPGFAWAWRKSALDATGGLLDRAILGAADHHMAWSIVGQGVKTVPVGMTAAYKDMVALWESHAAALRQNVGYVNGTILHRWHGPKRDRGYVSRWKILEQNQFDPRTDVRPDSRGVLTLTGNKPALRDGIRAYFRSRNEDRI